MQFHLNALCLFFHPHPAQLADEVDYFDRRRFRLWLGIDSSALQIHVHGLPPRTGVKHEFRQSNAKFGKKRSLDLCQTPPVFALQQAAAFWLETASLLRLSSAEAQATAQGLSFA